MFLKRILKLSNFMFYTPSKRIYSHAAALGTLVSKDAHPHQHTNHQECDEDGDPYNEPSGYLFEKPIVRLNYKYLPCFR
jgi:hypothetical protein